MKKLLVNAPSGRQEIIEVGKGGGYFDASRVLWDERIDGTLPSITLGGMVRTGNALEFNQSVMDASLLVLAAEEEARILEAARITAKEKAYVDNLPSWTQVQTAIGNIANIADVKAYLLKLSRVVYWDVKNRAD